MTRRTVALILLAAAVAPAGCAHNPGYFPYLLPGGPITESHAKPGGRGYFRNFDPKAVRLEVTPDQQINAPLGSQVVLVGTVMDADGQPRRSRRVEWLLDGPGAVLVSRGGSGTGVSQSGTGAKEAEADTDANGDAAVRLVQQSPKTGKTRVAVEVVKPPESGTGPGTVVSRRETVVEWAEPKIHLAVNAPKVAPAGGTFPVTVLLDNEAAVDSRDARVKVTLTDGATLAQSNPPPVSQDRSGVLTFDLPPVAGKAKQEVTLDVKPAKLGPVTVTAEAATADGFQASNKATTRVEQGKLQLAVEPPADAVAGEQVPFKVTVTNAGPARAENVTVWARYDDGLKFATPHNPVELAAGALAPGQTKTLDLPLTATKPGRASVRATVTADGGLTGTAEPAGVTVRKVELSAAVAGPKLVYLDQEFDWTVTVKNTGDTAATNVGVRASVPAEAKVKSVEGGRLLAGSVEWKVAELRPGDQKTYRVTATAAKLAAAARLAVSVVGDAAGGTRTVGDTVEAKAEAAVAIVGTPAVVLELATPSGAVQVGKRVSFQVRVRNKGSVAARNVEVVAFAPPELHPVRGTGPSDARVEGTGKVVFPAVDELRPGEALTFTIDVDAVQAGDARFRAEVRAAHLTNALKEEQATRVAGR